MSYNSTIVFFFNFFFLIYKIFLGVLPLEGVGWHLYSSLWFGNWFVCFKSKFCFVFLQIEYFIFRIVLIVSIIDMLCDLCNTSVLPCDVQVSFQSDYVRLFTWLLLFRHVSQCSKSCGSGHRRRALQCVDQNQQEVHEMYCVNLIRPPDQERCNTQGCELIWITGEWTEVRAQTGSVKMLGWVSFWSVHSSPVVLTCFPIEWNKNSVVARR